MRRVNLFLVSLLISVIALLVTIIIGFNVPYSNTGQFGNWMGGQMGGGMMGQTSIATSTLTAGYFWTLVATLSAWTVISIAGLAYYLAYPQINMGSVKAASFTPQQTNVTGTNSSVSAFESIEKTLTEDERKVINKLNLHQGKYLQKYITKEAGLSKLKTHRIVTRLAERGIVTLEKTGNTNTVTLADWLKKKE
jgi:predicted transcriptional regulator